MAIWMDDWFLIPVGQFHFHFSTQDQFKKPFEIKIYYSIRFFEHQDWPNLEGSFSLILRPIHQDNKSHSARVFKSIWFLMKTFDFRLCLLFINFWFLFRISFPLTVNNVNNRWFPCATILKFIFRRKIKNKLAKNKPYTIDSCLALFKLNDEHCFNHFKN